MVSITSDLSIRTLSRSGAVGWSYSGKPYRLKRSLASSTRRLISAARPAFLHTVAPRYTKLGGLLVHLAGCLGNESATAHTFRHEAHGLPLGFGNCPRERTTHRNDICHHLRKAIPPPESDARVVCDTAFPRSVAAPRRSPGVYIALSPPLALLIPHLGAHHILHAFRIGAKPLHCHTQYGK